MEERKIQIAAVLDARDVTKGLLQIEDAGKRASSSLKEGARQAGEAVEKIGDGAATSAAKVEAGERRMEAAIKRRIALLESAGKGERAYQEALLGQRGYDTARFKPLLDQLDAAEQKSKAARAALAGTTTTLNQVGVSAAQTAAALRNVPAQFTDIATSLAGGQAPLTVLLQQGGQLKDMFGGLGPAARALGGYVAGLINPFTLAAAGASALAVAWFQGSKEAEAYNRALILSGNAIGTTAGQLAQMARSMSEVSGTQGRAAAALAELAGSSQIASRNLEQFAQVAIDLERTVGQSVAETRKQFDDLGRAPLQALTQLNQGTNFLTTSLYENVKALQEQGRFTEAAETAQRGYAAAMAERTRALVENTGIIERAWKGVTSAAKGAWDAMLNVGRQASAADQIAGIDREIAKLSGPDRLSNRIGITAVLGGGDAARVAALREQKAALLELVRLEEEGGAARAESARRTQAIIEADKVRLQYATKQKQMEVEIAQARSRLQAAGAPESEIAAIEAQIRKRFAESSSASSAGLKSTNEELRKQGDLLAKLAGLTTTFAEDWARINTLFAAGKISREETLRLQGELLAQQPAMKDAAKAEADARKEAEKAAEAQFEAQRKLIEQQAKLGADAQSEISRLREAAQERGLSADAIDRLRTARLNEADAQRIQQQQMMLMEATSDAEVSAIQQTIASLEELIRLRTAGTEAGIADRSAKEWADSWSRTTDQIGQSLSDALMKGGKSAKEYLEGLFRNLVLRPVFNAVINPLSSGIQSVLGGAGGVANAASSGGSLLGSLGGLAGSLGGLSSGLGFGFQGLLGSLGLGGSSISGVLGVAGSLASQGSIMAALGTVAGALGPIALGVAAIASLLKDGGGPKTGGSFSTDGSRLFTPADQDALAATFGQSIQQGYTQALARLGGTNPGLQYGIGFDLDPQGTAASRVSSFIGTYRETDTEIGRTTEEMQAGVTQAVQRAILAGLQQSDFPAQIESIFDGLDVATATADQIGAAIQAAEAMRGLLDSAAALRIPLDAVSQAMIDAAGGVESLTAGFASYYQVTRTEEEKLADLRAEVAESFAAVGAAVPDTIAGYRDLVESLDLSTEAGQEAYAQLILLAPAMQQLTQASGGLTEAIGAMTQAAQGAVAAASGWPTADDWIQYANAIGDPQVLATSLERSFADAWARLELGDAFPVPTTIEQFKAAIAGLNVSAMGSVEWAGKLRGALNLSGEFASLINATSNFGAAAVNAANSISSAISALGSIRSLLTDDQFKARLTPLLETQWATIIGGLGTGAAGRLGLTTDLPTSKAALLEAYDAINAIYPETAAIIARDFLPAWSDLTQSVTAVEKPARAAAKAVNTMADQIKSALQSLADYARGLFASDLAPGTPEEQLKAAQALYSETLGKAQAGDLTAINNLRTVSDTYLREAREFYASSAGYTTIFRDITSALLALTGSSAPGAVVTVQQDERLITEARRTTKYTRDTSRTLRRETARV